MRYRIVSAALLVLMAATLTAPAFGAWVYTPQTGRWVNVGDLPKETPELQLEHARTLMLKGEYSKALDETRKFTKYYGDVELSDENEYLRGEILLKQGNLKKAAEQFQRVVSNYPQSDLYEDVIAQQYAIGDAYYEKGLKRSEQRWRPFRKRPFRKAIEIYNTVIDNQPFTRAAAEAQYKVGLCHYKRAEYIEAAYEYRRVIEDYSASEWVDDARHGLALCYYEASHEPPYDQLTSRLAINAIDDFVEGYARDERASDLLVKRAQLRSTIAQQRLLVARFYQQRRDFEAARIYYQTVADEFADCQDEAAYARDWLAEYDGGDIPTPVQ